MVEEDDNDHGGEDGLDASHAQTVMSILRYHHPFEGQSAYEDGHVYVCTYLCAYVTGPQDCYSG